MTPPGKKTSKPRANPRSGGKTKKAASSQHEPLFHAAKLVFYEWNISGSEVRFWGDVEGVLGFTSSELSGDKCKWAQRIHPDDLLRFSGSGVEKKEGKPSVLEYRICRKNGSVAHLRDTSCHQKDKKTGKLHLTGALQDISEQCSLFAHVCHLQKMQVFGKLAGGIAHDYNNALTIIQGYMEILQAGLPPEDPRNAYLNEIAAAIERSKTLSSQLMNFSKFKQNAPRAIRPGSVLLEFRKMLRRIIGENIELAVNAEEENGWVMADPRQIESLLINLVINACEAMPKGGRLSIDVVEKDNFVQIIVSDTGIGMEKAVLKRLLKTDFSNIPPEDGKGLGLPICLGIVRQNGGTLTAKSLPGKGTAIRVSLPRIDVPLRSHAKGIAPMNLSALSGKGEKILIVEDDASVQATVAALTQGLGYQIVCSANGDEARRILEKDGKIRLVICDLIMPLMGGSELLALVRRQWPEIKILLTSGYASAFVDRTPPLLNHTAFLPKPLSRGVLAAKLRELLDA